MLLHMTRCATGSMLAPLKNVPAMPKRYLTLFELIVHVSNWFDFITIRHLSCSVDRCLHDVVSERSGEGFEHAACRRSRGHVRTSPNNTCPCYQELGPSSSSTKTIWDDISIKLFVGILRRCINFGFVTSRKEASSKRFFFMLLYF